MHVSISTGSTDGGFPWDQLIPVLPQLFVLVLLAALLVMIGPRRLASSFRRIKKVGFAGLEIELADFVEAAASDKHVEVSSEEAGRAARTLANAAQLLSCSRILWVDDLPLNNEAEMKVLRRLCVAIDLAGSTAEARRALESGVYDIVISDMGRGPDKQAGRAMMGEVGKAPLRPALIYYVGEESQVPEGAVGTNRPDKLFRLIADAVKRRRG
jgi:hypothetical protein